MFNLVMSCTERPQILQSVLTTLTHRNNMMKIEPPLLIAVTISALSFISEVDFMSYLGRNRAS